MRPPASGRTFSPADSAFECGIRGLTRYAYHSFTHVSDLKGKARKRGDLAMESEYRKHTTHWHHKEPQMRHTVRIRAGMVTEGNSDYTQRATIGESDGEREERTDVKDGALPIFQATRG